VRVEPDAVVVTPLRAGSGLAERDVEELRLAAGLFHRPRGSRRGPRPARPRPPLRRGSRNATRSPAGSRNAPRLLARSGAAGTRASSGRSQNGNQRRRGGDLLRIGHDSLSLSQRASLPRTAASSRTGTRPWCATSSSSPRWEARSRTRGTWRTLPPLPPRSGCRIADTAGCRPSLRRNTNLDARRREGPMPVLRPRREDGHGRRRDGPTGPCTGLLYRARWRQVQEAEIVALSSGVRLGPYEVVAPLGRRNGEVYRARDTRLGGRWRSRSCSQPWRTT